MCGVANDHARAAVVDQVREFRIGTARIDRDADRAGAGNREVALHHLHAVTEVDRGPVARLQPQAREVPGDVAGTGFQLRIAHRTVLVAERGLGAELLRVCAERLVQRPDQFRTQHFHHILSSPGAVGGISPAAGSIPDSRPADTSVSLRKRVV